MTLTPSRTEVRQVRCPACGAPPGERCRGTRGKPREANHAERVALIPRRNPNTQPVGAFREAVERMAQRDFFDDPLGADAVESTAEEAEQGSLQLGADDNVASTGSVSFSLRPIPRFSAEAADRLTGLGLIVRAPMATDPSADPVDAA